MLLFVPYMMIQFCSEKNIFALNLWKCVSKTVNCVNSLGFAKGRFRHCVRHCTQIRYCIIFIVTFISHFNYHISIYQHYFLVRYYSGRRRNVGSGNTWSFHMGAVLHNKLLGKVYANGSSMSWKNTYGSVQLQ